MTISYLLSVDQGTSSTRAVIFDDQGRTIASHQCTLPQFFPKEGWIEHDPEQIWQDVKQCCQKALEKSQLSVHSLIAMGISNQRETIVMWDKKTGKPIYPAIVWQDRRTTSLCKTLIDQGYENTIRQKTGLLLDPYFSATKIAWLLDNVSEAKHLIKRNQLAVGTIDTFLLWRLTGGKSYATDATNASRTLLFNIHDHRWDPELLSLFQIPLSILPEVKNTCDDFGLTTSDFLHHEIPVCTMVGDQQAASIAQACFKPGMLKSTYGTGCFMMMNTGNKPIPSQHRLLTTIAYRIHNQTTYALEGSIFVAGAAVHWLQDALALISDAKESERLAIEAGHNQGVYLVPAFTGMGAPYWDPKARGAILGLTRDTGVAHIVRAALEAVCYQTRDLLDAMLEDGANHITTLRVDGGMVNNDWLMQFLSDILQLPIERSGVNEASAQGAGLLAGSGCGIFSNLDDIARLWHQDRLFKPTMAATNSQAYYSGWQQAVARICH